MKWCEKIRQRYCVAYRPSVNPFRPERDIEVPYQHFDGEWSISTPNAHGEQGVVRVQPTRLESTKLPKGGDDIFRGTRSALLDYVARAHPGHRVVFV